MQFTDVAVYPRQRFSVGVEADSGRFYLSIPVSNPLVDYEEYYEIDRAQFDAYRSDPASAAGFLARCRNRDADDLLMIQPGRMRGVAT